MSDTRVRNELFGLGLDNVYANKLIPLVAKLKNPTVEDVDFTIKLLHSIPIKTDTSWVDYKVLTKFVAKHRHENLFPFALQLIDKATKTLDHNGKSLYIWILPKVVADIYYNNMNTGPIPEEAVQHFPCVRFECQVERLPPVNTVFSGYCYALAYRYWPETTIPELYQQVTRHYDLQALLGQKYLTHEQFVDIYKLFINNSNKRYKPVLFNYILSRFPHIENNILHWLESYDGEPR